MSSKTARRTSKRCSRKTTALQATEKQINKPIAENAADIIEPKLQTLGTIPASPRFVLEDSAQQSRSNQTSPSPTASGKSQQIIFNEATEESNLPGSPIQDIPKSTHPIPKSSHSTPLQQSLNQQSQVIPPTTSSPENNSNPLDLSQTSSPTATSRTLPNDQTLLSQDTTYATILSQVAMDLQNPFSLQKLICNRLPNIGLTAFPISNRNGFRIVFKTKADQDRFYSTFTEKDFGPQTHWTTHNKAYIPPTRVITKTTFTCVVCGVPAVANIADIKEYLQKTFPITNVTRIQNDKGPLPLIRIFTQDPSLVSHLITNGITIGYCRYRVEESRTSGRPLPCRRCYKYHEDTKCREKPNCYKCGAEHHSTDCNAKPKTNYCATCRITGHRTASADCPQRPLRSNTAATNPRIYRNAASPTYAEKLQQFTSYPPLPTNNHSSMDTDSQTSTTECSSDADSTSSGHQYSPLPSTPTKRTSNSRKKKTSHNTCALLISQLMNEFTDKITKWLTTILAMTTDPDKQQFLKKSINDSSEEILGMHFNIVTSQDGHISVTRESYTKNYKTNKRNRRIL